MLPIDAVIMARPVMSPELPIRRNYDGDVPVDGSSGENEWNGFIPFDQLPAVYNPPSGLIVTANQNPFPANFPYRVGGNFASPYRARQIRDMLSSRGGWRPADMVAIQKDVYSGFLLRLSRAVVAAWDRSRTNAPGVPEAVEILRTWNGQVEKGAAAPFIASLTYQHLRKVVGERASRVGAVYGAGRMPNTSAQAAPVVVETLLRTRPADWFADWDAVLRRSLQDAVEEGQRIQGRKVARWDWGAYNRLLLAHPVGSRLPLVSQYFNIGPVDQSGSSLTVKQTTRRLGPSMRFAADTADWDNSELTLVTGVSAHVLSSHYKDNWESYYAGRGLPFRYRRPEIRSALTISPRR
jgi:penicillin amidase